MEGDQGKVIQWSLRSAQGCFQNLGRTLDDLDQVVVHGAGHIKDECKGGCALRDVLLCGPGPCILPGAKRHWQRKGQPHQSAAHFSKFLGVSFSTVGTSEWVSIRGQRHRALKNGLERILKKNVRKAGLQPAAIVRYLWFLVQFLCAEVAASHLSVNDTSAVPAAAAVPVVCSQEPLFSPVIQRPPLSWAESPPGANTPCRIAVLWLDEMFWVTSRDRVRNLLLSSHAQRLPT